MIYFYFCRIIVRKDEQLHKNEAINPPVHLVWEGHHDGLGTKFAAYIFLQDSKRSSEATGNFRLHFEKVDDLDFQPFKWYNQSSSHVEVNRFKVCGMGQSC